MIVNKKWYSVLISLLLVWFLIVLTTGIFNLILNEMKSNRAMWDYIKAYAWAESAQELALLDIKEYWYWYENSIEKGLNEKSVMLTNNLSDFKWGRDVLISYSINWKVNSYSWSLDWLWYDIVPLFYIDSEKKEQEISNLVLDIKEWSSEDLSWNIVWKKNWISWKWEIWEDDTVFQKTLDEVGKFIYEEQEVKDFFKDSTVNYLILFNSWNDKINYNLSTIDLDEYFTKPSLDIISSWEISSYKQNLKTTVNNTKFLDILKYSIYSN